DMVSFISNVGAVKPLIVTEKVDKNVYISARNLQKTAVTFADLINVYDILKHDTLVVSEAALARIEEVFI
ncbi:MAG: 50S ribosomal protein L4, partial [Fenollaria timonensis]